MNDTGNSWNGASVEVVQDGISIGTYTVPGGGTNTETVMLCEGSNIELVWSAGTFDAETIFDMHTPWATSIYSWAAGGNPSAGTFHTFTATCTPPSCPTPSSLGIANVNDTSVDLLWTENGSATTWNIEWGPEGFTQGTGTTVAGTTTNPHNLTGLTAATAYDFYVQADCGVDSSFLAGPFTFNTASCPLIEQCTYTMILEDSFGDTWNGASVTVEQDGAFVGEYTMTGGNIETFTVDLCNLSSIELIWTTGSFDAEIAFTMNDPNSVLVTSFATGAAPGAGVFHSFTASCPTCPAPSNLMATNLTENSADLSWTEVGSASLWNIEYGPEGFTQGSGTLITGTSSNPYSITGLTASTSYDFYVQADCGGGDESVWIGPFEFATLCTTIPAPYFEDFENAGLIPLCWVNDVGEDFDWEFNTITPTANTGPQSGDHTSGSGYFAFTEATNPNNPYKQADLLSPLIDISTLTSPSLNFWYHMLGFSMGELHVDINDGTWHNDIFITSGDQGDVWNEVYIDISAYTSPVQVRFRGITGDNFASDMAIDDVSFDEMPTCPSPLSLSAIYVTDVSADLSWTEVGGATLWNIEYGPAGFTQGTGTMLTGVTSNPYALTGLSPYTDYSFYVQSDCGGGDESNWTGPYTFSTLMGPVSNPSACEMGMAIPDNDCIDVPIDVTGLVGSQLGTDIILSNVNIIIEHTADMDVHISLESPNGVTVDLSTGNGGMSDNYGIIDGTCTQYTNFNMTGVDGDIFAGTPPYLGSFIPEGDFTDFDDDSNPNGYWILHVCDNMGGDTGTLEYVELEFELLLPPADIIINEVDCDMAVSDTAEFVELYDGGIGNYPLDGHAIVFYNGSSDQSYQSFDLDGYTTDVNGYFVLGNADVSGVDMIFPDNTMQNGADAVALYFDDASSFPIGTPLTQTNLVDALVYETNDPTDIQLIALLNPGQPQINEDNIGNKNEHSCSRLPNGTGGKKNTFTYDAAMPTPDGPNAEVPELVWDATTFTESLTNDGSIGNGINLELNGNTFTTLGVLSEATHFNSTNVPTGLTAQITVLTDTTAIIELIGNASSHLDVDDISNLGIEFLDAAYSLFTANDVINNSENSIIVDFFDTTPQTLVWSDVIFYENTINDGSILTLSSLTLWAETFTVASGLLTESTHYSVNNVPAGLTVEITALTDTTAGIVLLGNATNHANIDDISNMEITFLDAIFTGGTASNVADYSLTNLSVDYLDPYVVDLALSISPDTVYVCNQCVCPGPNVYLHNVGDLDIPINDTVYVYYQYPPLVSPVEDTIIMPYNLAVGDSLLYNPAMTVTQLGIYSMEVYIVYGDDTESSNDTAYTIINSYEITVDLGGGANDTLIVPSYPHILRFTGLA